MAARPSSLSDLAPEAVVVVPVLGRPDRVDEFLALARSACGSRSYRVLFVASPGDAGEHLALRAAKADWLSVSWEPGPGDWAKKVNLAYRATRERWIFTGADDLSFAPGWLDEALALADETGTGVVGTCDGGRNPRVARGEHSTHSLVARWYADGFGTASEKRAVVCEEYDHQYADDELVETAKARGLFAFAENACVLHDHPYFGRSEMDPTYEKAIRATAADRALFQRRRPLWEQA